MDTAKKDNKIQDFFKAFLYIFLYAFKGLKFLLLDIWYIIFSSLSFNADRAYQKVSHKSSDDDLYDRIKGNRFIVVKTKTYSEKELAKYDKMKEELARDLQTKGATRSKNPNVYEYIVRDVNGTGKIFKDTMAGFSKLDVNSFLVNEGYEVYSIKTSKYINFMYQESILFGKRISNKDLIFLLTQIATYIKAGITLTDSVKILSEQMKHNRSVSKVLLNIKYELTLGDSFSSALAKQGNFFPALLINMVKAAEATGTLQETLEEMSTYYTEVETTRKDMISALSYPALITVFAVAVLTFIIIYVVPQFTTIYSQSGIEITGLTLVIVNFSDFLSANIMTIVLLILLIMVGIALLYSKVKAFRLSIQMFLMRLPIIKNVIIYKEVNIFSKTFASLLRNNVYITESMDILSKITNNEVYKAIMFKTVNNIVKGEKISDAFKDHWAIPDVAYHMIVTGESTGQLAEMMQKVSDYYQESHKQIVKQLKSLIEPVVIALLAVLVGIIIIAVIVPMFQMYKELS